MANIKSTYIRLRDRIGETISSPIKERSRDAQMNLLRQDIRFCHRTRGPLRKQGDFIRAHFVHRLIDAQRAA